jgi:putative lipoic acid-binding regulatory protein
VTKSDDATADEAHARAKALIEATHQFPCAYSLTVIAFNSVETTVALKSAVAQDLADLEHQVRESSAGKYLSHRFSVPVEGAVAVLELYARVRSVEGVVTIL